MRRRNYTHFFGAIDAWARSVGRRKRHERWRNGNTGPIFVEDGAVPFFLILAFFICMLIIGNWPDDRAYKPQQTMRLQSSGVEEIMRLDTMFRFQEQRR